MGFAGSDLNLGLSGFAGDLKTLKETTNQRSFCGDDQNLMKILRNNWKLKSVLMIIFFTPFLSFGQHISFLRCGTM